MRAQLEVLGLIAAERGRQDAKFPGQWEEFARKFGYPLGWDMRRLAAFEACTILGEEMGEVCRALCDNDLNNLRDELVQVAAVAVAWLEALGA